MLKKSKAVIRSVILFNLYLSRQDRFEKINLYFLTVAWQKMTLFEKEKSKEPQDETAITQDNHYNDQKRNMFVKSS